MAELLLGQLNLSAFSIAVIVVVQVKEQQQVFFSQHSSETIFRQSVNYYNRRKSRQKFCVIVQQQAILNSSPRRCLQSMTSCKQLRWLSMRRARNEFRESGKWCLTPPTTSPSCCSNRLNNEHGRQCNCAIKRQKIGRLRVPRSIRCEL